MNLPRRADVGRAALRLLMLILVCSPVMFAVEPAIPSSVDVYWKSTRTIAAPGATSVIVLDEEIAHAEIGNDTIELAGLSRGETVALAYVNGSPVSIVIRVIEHPVAVVPPSLLRRDGELAHGIYGSDFQTSSSGGASNFVLLNSLAWTQQVGDHRLDLNSQIEDNTQFGGHEANLRTGGLLYRTPHVGVGLVDFNQSLTGSLNEDHINNFSSSNAMELRGGSLEIDSAKNQYYFFGGSTIPFYFLSMNGTRDVAGFAFHRRQTERLSLFAGTSYVNIPTNLTSGIQRRNYVMQNAGFSYRLGKSFQFGAQGGVSNRGGLVRADASYTSFRLSGYGTVIFAAQTFPLNQLQSLFAGTSSAKGQFAYRTTSRLTQGLYVEHTDISPGLIYLFKGSSDYLSPNVAYRIARGESLNFTYTYSRNTGGFNATTTTGNRYDASLNSQLTARVANNAQVTIGSVQDPLQISSEDQFSVRDSVSLPIKSNVLLLGVEHDRVQPSLVTKLSQELNLLSPFLQSEFQANPTAFIDSSNFPPEIKALLAAEQPTGTTFTAAANVAIGAKLRFNPNFSLTYSDTGTQANTWSEGFGYSLSYQLRPTLQLRSSLNNVLLWDSRVNNVARTWVLSAGFQKTFTAVPGGLPMLHRSRMIEGRVFRDNNINGTFNIGEPGLAGVEVHLEDGEVAVTDEQGRYKFSSVSADQHEVSIALTQFRNPVRMTTRSEAEADLIQQRIAIVNFGILDFARVMGNVYNDLRFENRRQPDSLGMQDIELTLDNGREVRRIQTLGSGDFELNNVPPGDYKLSLDAASIPPNYQAPVDSVSVHVSPVATVVQEIPLRALRSISGRVLLRVNPAGDSGKTVSAKSSRQGSNAQSGAQELPFTLQPVSGVQIVAGPGTAVTDKDGNFLLRNLPAGELNVTIRPVRNVPQGINIPSGQVKLPAEPVQIQGATIVITNKELLPYLTRQFPGMPAMPAMPPEVVVTAKVNQPGVQKKKNVATVAAPSASGTTAGGTTTVSASPAKSAKAVLAPPATSTSPTSASLSTPPAPAAFPAISPVTPKAAPVGSAAPNPTAQNGSSILWTLTRADCEKLPSLGEAAQCFRQLKQATASQK